MPDYNKDLLNAIAHLFYAVSYADRNITKAEKVVIYNFIEDFSIHETFDKEDIYLQLRELIGSNISPKDAFAVFQEFYLQNKNQFTSNFKLELMKTSDEITSAFNNKNKSELVLLSQLHQLLSK